jgi:type IV pilus assembly protein PilO
MTVTRKWSLLALLLVVAIFAAGWFLLISPKRGEAAELRGRTASQDEANSRLEQKIQVLMAQQEDLPRKRAQLAVIRTRIPDNPALPTLVRELTAASQKVGASIVTLAPALPVAAAPAAQAPVATTDGTTGTAPAAPAAAALYQVPLTVDVSGSYFELEQFVNKLEGLKRAFLVTGFTLGADEGEEAVPGELKLSLQGRVFLSPEAATTVAAPATGTTATSTTPTGTTTTSDATAPAAQ